MHRVPAKKQLLAVLLTVAAISGSAFGAFPQSIARGASQSAEGAGGLSWLSLARTFSAVVPRPWIELIGGGPSISNGSDGRLTVLLLGSDTRGGGLGRTDTIMVFSLRGNSISAVSIPRDTARIPKPGGGTFSGRVNGILRQLKDGRTNEQALNEFRRVIENLLQIEIDYYALITFVGFHNLVAEVEPVRIDTREVRDTKYWDDPNKPAGVYFPKADNYELYALQPNEPSLLCNGLWKTQGTSPGNWCRRAMPYVRSRKGSSDFARAARQQDFVMAGIRRVLNRGGGGALNSLVGVARNNEGSRQLYTDIPINGASASDLFNSLSGASINFRAVLSPTRYASHIPGTTAYELDLDAVRATMRQYFGSTGSPPPQPTPTATPTATPTRTPTLPPGATPTPTPTRTPTLPPGATPTPTLPPGATPTPTLPPGATPTPTLPPGATPTPAPTAEPGSSATPAPTLAPGETPVPGTTPVAGPTQAPGATPAPGASAAPTAVAVVPSAAPGEPGATQAPGAVAPPTAEPGAPPASPTATDNNMLLVVAMLAALVAVASVLIGWRLLRPSRKNRSRLR